MAMVRLAVLVMALATALCGCAINSHTPPFPATYPVEPTGPYTLDTGDVLRVAVYDDTNLSGTYRVDDQGGLSMPLIGAVQVSGLTADQAGRRITAQLADGYLRNPNVAVEIAQYRPFYIQGAVNAAGQYPYVYGMTVRAAISTAGGHVETANRSTASVYRKHEDAMKKGTVSLDFPIMPGDVIVVPERWL